MLETVLSHLKLFFSQPLHQFWEVIYSHHLRPLTRSPLVFQSHIFQLRLLLFVYMYKVFTCFIQAPFFHLHGFYMFLTGPPFFIYMFFTCFTQAPCFHLNVFYMFLTVPFFFHLHALYLFLTGHPFKFFLLVSYRSPSFIYMLFANMAFKDFL